MYYCAWCELAYDEIPTCHTEISNYVEFEWDSTSPIGMWEQMMNDPKARTRFPGRWETTDPMLAFASDYVGGKCEWTEVIPQMKICPKDLIVIEGNTWKGFLSEVSCVDESYVTVIIKFTPAKKTGFIGKEYRVRRSSVIKRATLGCL